MGFHDGFDDGQAQPAALDAARVEPLLPALDGSGALAPILQVPTAHREARPR